MPAIKYLVMFYRIYEVEEDNSVEAEEQALKPFEADLETIMKVGTPLDVATLFSASVRKK